MKAKELISAAHKVCIHIANRPLIFFFDLQHVLIYKMTEKSRRIRG